MTPLAHMKRLREHLRDLGIETYVHKQTNNSSCYMGFTDPRIGMCRIGDHPERKRYGYRWNIRLDIKEPYPDYSKGHKQFFFPSHMLENAARRIKKYHQAILMNRKTGDYYTNKK
jgi:hypothetical protein